MADLLSAAIQAAAAAIERELMSGTDYSMALDSDEALARVALTAAAPLLAEVVAQKILEHAERQHPRDPEHVPTPWDRHFNIAARVAAGAFDSEEVVHRMVADSLSRGNFIACDIPEVPGG